MATVLEMPASRSATAAPDASAQSSLLARLNRLFAGVRRDVRSARAYDDLMRLDDRTLGDIGVHRTELTSITHHGRDDPTRRQR
jgi:uncharacterized protein YjiS (DUF1127 family)